RRRWRRRWRRHWATQEKALDGRRRDLVGEGERLRAQRFALTQALLRFNGEAELGKRQLRDGWDQLGRARRDWQAARAPQEADLARQRRELRDARDALAAAQMALAAQQAQARAGRAGLEKEAEGLENRVRNLRLKMAEHEADLPRPRGTAGPGSLAPAAQNVPVAELAEVPLPEPPEGEQVQRLGRLDALADALADQRLHLAEQWQRFLHAQQVWHEEHARLLPELEEAAR